MLETSIEEGRTRYLGVLQAETFSRSQRTNRKSRRVWHYKAKPWRDIVVWPRGWLHSAPPPQASRLGCGATTVYCNAYQFGVRSCSTRKIVGSPGTRSTTRNQNVVCWLRSRWKMSYYFRVCEQRIYFANALTALSLVPCTWLSIPPILEPL